MVRNTSQVTSIDRFVHLASVGQLPDPVNGNIYSIVIQGLTSLKPIRFCHQQYVDNSDLEHFDALLRVFNPQLPNSAGGVNVLVKGNPRACIDLDTWWVTLPLSYVEYPFAQVWSHLSESFGWLIIVVLCRLCLQSI
jgi:hypothetical protein